MPATQSSARFVGRDEAFGRLAAGLGDAAGGRARTILLEGTAGVGVTRFIDEAMTRLEGVAERRPLLRATAWPAWADDPYGPLVRAIAPTLRALPMAELADLLGPAGPEVVRLMPDLAPVLDVARPTGWSGGVTAPERRQARTLEGILGVLRPLGGGAPGGPRAA